MSQWQKDLMETVWEMCRKYRQRDSSGLCLQTVKLYLNSVNKGRAAWTTFNSTNTYSTALVTLKIRMFIIPELYFDCESCCRGSADRRQGLNPIAALWVLSDCLLSCFLFLVCFLQELWFKYYMLNIMWAIRNPPAAALDQSTDLRGGAGSSRNSNQLHFCC